MNSKILSQLQAAQSKTAQSKIARSKAAIVAMIALMLMMLATRAFHVASALYLPDASWALFFLAGYYLGFASFGILLLEAVAIDVIFLMSGGDPYCFSVAYGFLGIAYLALWLGGDWANRAQTQGVASLLRGVIAWFVAAGVAYLLTNGSFYWLSDKAVNPSVEGWMQNARVWAFGFIVQPMVYLGAAAVVHFIAQQFKSRELIAS